VKVHRYLGSDDQHNRIGDTCQPYAITPPEEPLFETDKIVIVSNGRCTSSCALFSVCSNALLLRSVLR